MNNMSIASYVDMSATAEHCIVDFLLCTAWYFSTTSIVFQYDRHRTFENWWQFIILVDRESCYRWYRFTWFSTVENQVAFLYSRKTGGLLWLKMFWKALWEQYSSKGRLSVPAIPFRIRLLYRSMCWGHATGSILILPVSAGMCAQDDENLWNLGVKMDTGIVRICISLRKHTSFHPWMVFIICVMTNNCL